MIENGRPRYWIGWYDRWHFLLPAALLIAVGWILAQPRPRQIAPSPSSQVRVVALGETTLEAPVSGAQLRGDRLPEVEGRAVPGTTVVLFYSQAPSLERRELARVRVRGDGRYRFRLSQFPPGGFVFQSIAYADDGRTAASAPVDVWVLDPRPAARRPRR